LNRPEYGIRLIPVDELRFGSTLPNVRIKGNLYYHPESFFIDLRHNLWIRSQVVIGTGWKWKYDVYGQYYKFGIKSFKDLYNFMEKYVPLLKLKRNFLLNEKEILL